MSCPRLSDTLIIVHTLSWAIIEKIIDNTIAKPNSALSSAVNAAVCNINPGPIDEVANTNIRCGFVHIPYLPEQVVTKPGQPSMAKNIVVEGLQSMVNTICSGKRYEIIDPVDYVIPHD